MAVKRWHRNPEGAVLECTAQIECRYAQLDLPHADANTAVEAERIIYRRESGEADDKGTKVVNLYLDAGELNKHANLESFAANPREFAYKLARIERELGQNINRLNVSGTVSLFKGVTPIRIEKKYFSNSTGLQSQWILERDEPAGPHGPARTVKQVVNPNSLVSKGGPHDTLRKFFDKNTTDKDYDWAQEKDQGMSFAVEGDHLLTREEREERLADRREQTEKFLYETLSALEGTQKLGNRRDGHAVIDQMRSASSGLVKNHSGLADGVIGYRSGWRPEHLRNMDVGDLYLSEVSRHIEELSSDPNRRTPTYVKSYMDAQSNSGSRDYYLNNYSGLADTMKIQENGNGEGAASWKMERDKGEWVVKIRGTRGDLQVIRTKDPEEAAMLSGIVFDQRVKKRNLSNEARQFRVSLRDLERQNYEDSTKDKQVKNRSEFIGKLVSETNSLEERIERVATETVIAEKRRAEIIDEINSTPQKKGLFRR